MNGNKIKRRREMMGLTQAQLVEIAKISRKTLTSYENGSECSTRILKKIAAALNCDYKDLI